MTAPQTNAAIDAILGEILELEKITAHLSAENCELWDSANHLRIVLGIEEALSIRFTIAEIESATTRKKLIEIVATKENNG